ncbi:cell division protein SepF [Lactobacillus nasalidis]|uniref:Cell division protein SepF n=1 Tax=Lactobacillus nasalidis TaxID=2797258 RepID=A0ABQ3W485_9LACO|nr:cell division protein SepF [Lactobacillus nasalidis]GHV98329.1 cell division protein SepF [Lactobacillus nasalidis]GHV99813.1 cell division protein SepF [Lactobacillus nasalidis]GHW01323.1 cell division protein SepF [Lactobacillus nasalidis]
MNTNKLKDFFGFGDSDSYQDRDRYDEQYEEEEEMESSYRPVNSRDNVVSIKAGQASAGPSKIVLYEPRVYSDAKEVAQNLLNQKAIIINFSRMDDASARRVVDFITGTVYALNGEIQRVGDKIFLATPPKFETDGKITELLDKKDTLG